MAHIIDLAAARASRTTLAAAPYTEEQYARALRIGHQMADAVNSGRVDLSRPGLRGTVAQERELLAKCEALLEKLRRRDAGRA